MLLELLQAQAVAAVPQLSAACLQTSANVKFFVWKFGIRINAVIQTKLVNFWLLPLHFTLPIPTQVGVCYREAYYETETHCALI
jgi:hypothetical protein